jgi:hypothetical protein
MKVISVLGRKGGSGKTLVSHFISLGFGSIGFDTVMLQTDVRCGRPTERIDNRPYWLTSIVGDPEKDKKIMREAYVRTERIPNSVLVVDGGANRRAVDYFIAETSHIILIPVGCSEEDIAVAESDYDDLSEHLIKKGKKPSIYYILNRWPGDARRLEVVMKRRIVNKFLDANEKKRFPIAVVDMNSLADITSGTAFSASPMMAKRAIEVSEMLSMKLGLSPTPMAAQ